MTFTVTSTSFQDGDRLDDNHALSEPFGFGCSGGNISPALTWTDAPEGTQSLAVTCFDPDAPTGSGFWHWILVNLPASITSLEEAIGTRDTVPGAALHVVNDYGTTGYGGPCPPPGHGPHRYVFTVHAVAVDALPVDRATPQAIVRFQLHANTLATATITGTYERRAS